MFVDLTCDISVKETNGSNAKVSVGATVVFYCSCNDTMKWKLNGNFTDIEINDRFILCNNTLTVDSVRTSDIGNYTCGDNNFALSLEGKMICNEISLIYLFFVLDTFVKSVVIPHPSLCINESATLECHVTLNTAIGSDLSVLIISWYHNGTYISTNSITRDDDQSLYISTLHIMSVKGTSSGNYTCQAKIVEDERTKLSFTTVSVKGQHIFYVLM